MTVTVLWAAKGGSGTTTVVAATAVGAPGESRLVDLAGDLPAVLGIPEPTGDGIADWATTTADAAVLELLTIDVNPSTRLVPRGRQPIHTDPSRWSALGHWLRTRPGDVVIDAGTGRPPPALVDTADHSLLVTRPCYLALRSAVAAPCRPTGVVLIREPGRALNAADVERVIGVPVVTHIDVDPAIARAIDAGLLAARIPAALRRSLQIGISPAFNPRIDATGDPPADAAHDNVSRWRQPPSSVQHEPPPLDIA